MRNSAQVIDFSEQVKIAKNRNMLILKRNFYLRTNAYLPVRFLSFFLLASVSVSAFAEFSVYTIDNTLKAVFPQEPTFTGEAGTGTSHMRGYNYADLTNGIFYSANYSLNPIPYAENEIRKEIEQFVKGNLPGINGKLLRIEYTRHGSEQGAHCVISFDHQGIQGRKFSAVIFRGGRFFVWTVQDIPAISTLDANAIFDQYVMYFRWWVDLVGGASKTHRQQWLREAYQLI